MKRTWTLWVGWVAVLALAGALGGCGGTSKKIKQANVHRQVGETYLSQMKVAQALTEFQKGLELNPDDAQLLHDAGLAMLLRQEFDKAEIYLKRALDKDGSMSEARNHLAVVYLSENKPAEALEQIDKALKDKNFISTGKAYFNQAKAYLMLNQTQSAIEALEKAIERNPSDIRPYLDLADLHLKQKDYAKSAFAARRAIEFYPNDYRAWFMLGKALQAQNDRAGALDAFKNTQKNAPENSEEFIRAGSFLKLLKSQ
jgi:tetratricopeptide (TPR) repeat protein